MINLEKYKTKNQEIIIQICLLINNELFKENKITYKNFHSTEKKLLNKLKNIKE